MIDDDRTLDIREGAVRFRVLSAGRGPHLVSFHSFHERGGWSPFLDRLAARYTGHAPFPPRGQGSSGGESLDDVPDLVLAFDQPFHPPGHGAPPPGRPLLRGSVGPERSPPPAP